MTKPSDITNSDLSSDLPEITVLLGFEDDRFTLYRFVLDRLNRIKVFSERPKSADEISIFIQKLQPDVVFLDWMMLGRQFEVLRQIKIEYPDIISIIYIVDDRCEQFALDAGADVILRMPLSLEDLVFAIRRTYAEKHRYD